ncbi:MAG: hypothetical protein L6Q55_12425 [Azonexus sp.]|nr:hypothetical protein [Azonexus sp.]MCK6413215.1 hypothetical protein [Azonexus sp.]
MFYPRPNSETQESSLARLVATADAIREQLGQAQQPPESLTMLVNDLLGELLLHIERHESELPAAPRDADLSRLLEELLDICLEMMHGQSDAPARLARILQYSPLNPRHRP